jgi:hypothetical protein
LQLHERSQYFIGTRDELFRVAAMRVYEVRPRKDKCGLDLISDALPFGRLWYGEPNAVANAIGHARPPRPFT